MPTLGRMKTLFILLILSISMTGCFRYGTGTFDGYVTGTEDAIFWEKVYMKTDLTSSNEDCMVFNKGDDDLHTLLKDSMADKTRVRITYAKHLFIVTGCGDDGQEGFLGSDEVVSVEEIK